MSLDLFKLYVVVMGTNSHAGTHKRDKHADSQTDTNNQKIECGEKRAEDRLTIVKLVRAALQYMPVPQNNNTCIQFFFSTKIIFIVIDGIIISILG